MNRRLVFVMDTDGKPEKLVVFNGNECYRVTQVSKDGNNTEAPYSIRSSFNALAENGSSNIELTLPAIMMFYQSFRSAHRYLSDCPSNSIPKRLQASPYRVFYGTKTVNRHIGNRTTYVFLVHKTVGPKSIVTVNRISGKKTVIGFKHISTGDSWMNGFMIAKVTIMNQDDADFIYLTYDAGNTEYQLPLHYNTMPPFRLDAAKNKMGHKH